MASAGSNNCAKCPDQLDIEHRNPSQAWMEWKEEFEIYLLASNLSKAEGAVKVGLLLNLIGRYGRDLYKSFEYRPEIPADGDRDLVPAESKHDYEVVLKKFDECFRIRDTRLRARRHFWLSLKRDPCQDFTTWISAVRKAAKKCKYPSSLEVELIRDKLIMCCNDEGALSELFNEDPETLSLEKTEAIISGREEIKKELTSFGHTSIDAVSKNPPRPKKTFCKPTRERSEKEKKCYYCGLQHKLGIRYCTAARVTCSKCHMSSMGSG